MKCRKYEESSLDSRNKHNLLIEYENKIALLSTEMERLNHVLRMKNEEIENWKINSSRINVQGQYEETRDFETKIHVLNAEIERLNIIIETQRREMNQSRVIMHPNNGYVQTRPNGFEHNELLGALTRENDDLRRSLYEKEEAISNIQRNKFGYM